VILPSNVGGRVTREVGYLDADPALVGSWLRDGMGDDWRLQRAGWRSLDEAVSTLEPSPLMTLQAAIPVRGWTLILTNGPSGTDVGMLPSQAARELGCRAVRAVCSEDDAARYPARILEVFGPDGAGPLLTRRAIAAANDGGRWVFETSGEPLPFERVDNYAQRRKADRLTSALLYEYLRALQVPIDYEPDWSSAMVIELSTAGVRAQR
jgi:hypothetical protein